MVWSDTELAALVREEAPSFYDDVYQKYERNINRWDAARAFILRRFGGTYLDLDVEVCDTSFLPNLSPDRPSIVANEAHRETRVCREGGGGGRGGAWGLTLTLISSGSEHHHGEPPSLLGLGRLPGCPDGARCRQGEDRAGPDWPGGAGSRTRAVGGQSQNRGRQRWSRRPEKLERQPPHIRPLALRAFQPLPRRGRGERVLG